MTYRTGGEGGILTGTVPASSAFSLTCGNNRMNTGDSAVSPILVPSTCSRVWAQFLSKTDTKDTKKPSRERPEVEQVYELQAGTIKVSIRENLVCIVSDRVS
jgi:hypothetical protein